MLLIMKKEIQDKPHKSMNTVGHGLPLKIGQCAVGTFGH